MDNVNRLYEIWCQKALDDQDIVDELKNMKDNPSQIEDAFYKNLTFGTGGLRGVIGAGTNKLNIYTVAKATQGLSDYLNKHYQNPSVVIGYDSRIKSDVFAKVACEVFAGNGIHASIYAELMPVPMVSYAVRHEAASAGVMITASHNPSKYNGYKVYNDQGCQITTEAAKEIYSYIENVQVFGGAQSISFTDGMNSGLISYISDHVIDDYIQATKTESLLGDEKIDKDVKIVYTPLNGSGLKPVLRILKETGFSNITVVKEQEQPDGRFPTCPYPNPEVEEAMTLGINYCKEYNADLLLATDPDCDRVGIAVKNSDNEMILLTANQVGILLLDYICTRRKELGTMPEHPVFAKTIVTMDLATKIASYYGVETVNTLTGFKFIGELIGKLAEEGREDSYIFGFEESYGYLSGTYVRDKDGVNAAMLICEMFAYYKSKGLSLFDKLHQIFAQFGYCMNTQHSFSFEGAHGMDQMNGIMNVFRSQVNQLGGEEIVHCDDFLFGLNGLPQSNVLKFFFDDGCSVVVRPSGTEPKLKVYISVIADDEKQALKKEKMFAQDIESYIVK